MANRSPFCFAFALVLLNLGPVQPAIAQQVAVEPRAVPDQNGPDQNGPDEVPAAAIAAAAPLTDSELAPQDLAEVRTETLLVPRGSEWRYLNTGKEAPADWATVGFHATDNWEIGQTPMGYDHSPTAAGIVTPISYGDDKDNKHAAVFFRHEFETTASVAEQPVLCQIRNDDGAIVYLNGAEVFRRNMPVGKPTMGTFALKSSKPESTYWTFVIPAGKLQKGKNIFAVRVHQRSGDSSDLIHDFEAIACSSGVAEIARRVQRRELFVFSEFESEQPAVISKNSTWHYRYGEQTPDDWMQLDFDASTWQTGMAPLGVGETEAKTDLSPGNGTDHNAAYFRKTFELSDAQAEKTLIGQFRFDDGAALFINGIELLRHNLPKGDLTAETAATKKIGNEDHFWTFVVQPKHLRSGKNVIAFSVHQFKDSTDLIAELSLREATPEASKIAADIQAKESGGNQNAGRLANPKPTLIALGSVWRYWDGQTVDENWQALDYDDREWSKGKSPLGYGDSHIRTEISSGDDANQKNPAAYFRHRFKATEAARMHGLVGRVLHDDTVMVFLNGQEVYRRNVPERGIKDDTYGSSRAVAGDAELHYWTFSIEPGHLRAGDNVLAVRVQQTGPASSDLSMDLELLIPTPAKLIEDRELRDKEAIGEVVFLEQAVNARDANNAQIAMIPCHDREITYFDHNGQKQTIVMDALVQARQYQPSATFARAMEGDTLQKLAAKHGLDIEKLRILNRVEGTKTYKEREIYLRSWAYAVTENENLADIARRLGVSKSDLIKLNDLPDDAVLKNGQDLQIPGKFTHTINKHNQHLLLGRMQNRRRRVPPFEPASLKQTIETLKQDETIATMAKRHNTTEKHLRKMNGLEKDEEPVGERVYVEYSVQPTKTATAIDIATVFDATVEDLLDLNELESEEDFDASNRVHIPVGQRRSSLQSVNSTSFEVYKVVLGSKQFTKIEDKYAVPKKEDKPASRTGRIGRER